MYKLMLVDSDSDRSGSLEAALLAAGYTHIIRIGSGDNLMNAVRNHQPDIILIDMQSPDRDTLESLRNVSRETPKPIVFFAEQSDYETTRAAINAGVSAYIVDDLPGKRLKSVLEVAIARFQEYQKLKEELEDYKSRLQDRKDVDKAKGILMQHRNLSEEEAYQLLRKMAMDRNMKIGEAARNFIAAMALLGGK
ncbi:MAG: ANTAR domain-containing protein [Thiothrix sp.]|uniref:ANTAR domain-containing response regulator n=1 Tax=Thiothrix sp. TaxID=1032 RepID=UPI00260CECAD|nr:ANTAR domain-containing protein [Thiothrix sp.]MDD5394073.1 ANTAR domain-containing protein [Thiothrix sp.]